MKVDTRVFELRNMLRAFGMLRVVGIRLDDGRLGHCKNRGEQVRVFRFVRI